MMKLGDFFTTAPHARPVNPRPVTFTAVSRGPVLPGGARNPHPVPVAATITGGLIFIGGDGALQARMAARAHLRRAFIDPETKIPMEIDHVVLECETRYQEVWRALFEWDADERRIGERLFPSVDNLREMVEADEVGRIYIAYQKYVNDEHPEGSPDDETFRGTQGRGQGVAGAPPR